MQSTSYWLDTASSFSAAAEGPVNGNVDVAVIGGGLTGLSAALELARSGASTTVLEAEAVIGRASGRNGGQCNVGVHQDFATLSQQLGLNRAAAYYRAYASAVDTVEAIVERENIDCDFRRCGKLKLAAKAHHFDRLQRSFELLSDGVDPQLELIRRDRIPAEIQSDTFFGGLLQKTSAALHVGRFGVGLADAVVRSGGKVFESALVTDIEKGAPGRYRVVSSRGTFECSDVLLATGGTPQGHGFSWYQRRIVPVGSFIIVTEPLDEAVIARLLPRRRCYVTSRHIGHHFQITADRRLLFGGRAQFTLSNPRTDRKGSRILQQALTRLFPELADAGIAYAWGGQIDMTKDRLPRAGRGEDGVSYSMGYSGHGVQMSVHMGVVMAQQISGQRTANPWENLPWPPIPGHFGKPWFLPAVGAYYRAVDYLS